MLDIRVAPFLITLKIYKWHSKIDLLYGIVCFYELYTDYCGYACMHVQHGVCTCIFNVQFSMVVCISAFKLLDILFFVNYEWMFIGYVGNVIT